MSLMHCRECEVCIDTDDDPESIIEGPFADYALCPDCRLEEFLNAPASIEPFSFRSVNDWFGAGLIRDMEYIKRMSKDAA